MAEKIVFDGLTVAPSVLDTMVRLATEQVKGVAGVGTGVRKTALGHAIELTANEDESLNVDVHIQAYFGEQLHELGRAVQSAIADALKSQLGAKVACVNVYVDGLVFAE